jgi:uncharacterized cupredoxin-like copper-binding protein
MKTDWFRAGKSGASVTRGGVIVVAAVVVASALTAAVLAQSSRSSNAAVAVKPVVVSVTAGKPTELAFKLSRYSLLPVGKPIEFKVSDGGVAFHDFKICTVATTSFKANSCTGLGTKVLHPSQSATLMVSLKKAGKYEFLCTLTGHAASGMKGLIGVGVTVTAAEEMAAKPPKHSTTTTTTTTPTTTTTTTTTTTKSTTTTTTTPLSECPPGVTIQSSGNSDNDADEGGSPSDLDGCI